MALYAFDLDDTLYKEADYVASGHRAVAHAINADTGISLAELSASPTPGENQFDVYIRVLERYGQADRWPVAGMLDVYRGHKPELSLSDDVREVLERLQARGHIVAVITDGGYARQMAKIRALGLDRIVPPENFYVGATPGAGKSTPLPFEWAEMVFAPSEHIYVGDNPAKDFRWPGRRGWRTVMLADTSGVNIHSQSLDVAPEFRPREVIFSLLTLLE